MMGACDFETYARGKTPQEAYRTACEQAEWDEGHDPYNGTISTTNSFTLVPRPARKSFKVFVRELREDAKKIDEAGQQESWHPVHGWGPKPGAKKMKPLKHPGLKGINPFVETVGKRDCFCFEVGPDNREHSVRQKDGTYKAVKERGMKQYLFVGWAAE